ncbi:hypothetical protein IWW34DRAFT_747133 [Fusarium oxysporum f. sp. albedinis]|jgi:hypothetical protein|nr:hypothetical protein IWW34DRAFT_747133 [Fusarium oxysporum f. sp. albedinis]KAK2481250.1 hypothetical protein H9L39_06889 [Fusarium oxysporum f. sp. albedinis]
MYPTIALVGMTWHCHAFQWLICEKLCSALLAPKLGQVAFCSDWEGKDRSDEQACRCEKERFWSVIRQPRVTRVH